MPTDGPGAVKALVDALVGRRSADDRRLYLFGHSAGAVFALKLGLMQSGRFVQSFRSGPPLRQCLGDVRE